MLFQWKLAQAHKKLIVFVDGKRIPAAHSRKSGCHYWSAKVPGTLCELGCIFQRNNISEKVFNGFQFHICCLNKYQKVSKP